MTAGAPSAPSDDPAWLGLFPDQDFAFRFSAGPGDAVQYFAPTTEHDEILAERRKWMTEFPERHLLQEPLADPLITEACELAQDWGVKPGNLLALGETLEPDLVLLQDNGAGEFVMRACAVCFPSEWAPEEKMSLPVHAIHSPVPTLNTELGERINKFLANLKPGVAWERTNWGMSRSPERNQHPALGTPRLVPPFGADEAWVRSEDQILVRLPQTGGLLFGIRIVNISLKEVLQHDEGAAGLHRAIATMPEAVAEYKNVAASREHLLNLLRPPV